MASPLWLNAVPEILFPFGAFEDFIFPVADIFSKRRRSAIMGRIRGRGNRTTELALVRLLRTEKINGWRRHRPALAAGKVSTPDFLFPRARVCVFVDGCFWHGCPRCFREPTSNVAYWRAKIRRNQRRDRRTVRVLRAAGFRVFRIWECRLKSPVYLRQLGRRLRDALDRSPVSHRAPVQGIPSE